MSSVRVRIAPSPTGFLHIGTARAALFNYLFAKKEGGAFVLRIEDTDVERSDPKFEKNIFDGLRWLGIEADESPEVGGPFAPYRQSERSAVYKKYLEKLLAGGKAFYCFHSEQELEEEKKRLLGAKRPPVHQCEYRVIAPAAAEDLKRARQNYIIRFKTPAGSAVAFHDLIRGDLSFQTDLIGDFSIAKAPDIPLFHFANVVDDAAMAITHVIRGEDHIANTPKHILLAEALGFPAPRYAHLPLILGPDRSKLSKRHGATSVDEYRSRGYLPEALFNFMALLGWNPGGDQEIFSKEEIIREFSLAKVQKSGAVFDVKKLDWMNGEYIRRKSVGELAELCLPFLEEAGAPSQTGFRRKETRFGIAYLHKVIALEQPRLKRLSEMGELADYFFRAPQYDKELLRWKTMSDQEILDSLNRSERIISEMQNFDFEIRGQYAGLLRREDGASVKPGDLGPILWPLRAALSGKKASPGPSEIMQILGKEETLARIRAAREKLKG